MDSSIGTAIRMLQAQLQLKNKGPAIALLALGPDSTETERSTFLNQFSRIKRSDVENPSPQTLEKIARGFGYGSLSEFFTALGQTSFAEKAKSETNSLRTKKSSSKVSGRKARRSASKQPLFLPGLPHALAPSSTADLSTAPPFDQRTKYILWSVVVLLTKHLRASDIAEAEAGARPDDAPTGSADPRVQSGRAPRRAGKNPRHV